MRTANCVALPPTNSVLVASRSSSDTTSSGGSAAAAVAVGAAAARIRSVSSRTPGFRYMNSTMPRPEAPLTDTEMQYSMALAGAPKSNSTLSSSERCTSTVYWLPASVSATSV